MTSHDAARSLMGKVALVTGAGRGLGRAFAERLASLGADVAIHGMRENGPAEYGEGTTLTAVAEAVAAEHGVRTIACSATSPKAPTSSGWSRPRPKELGPIDILVHNAGGDIAAAGGKPDPNDAVNISEEDVRAVLDRNLLSTILTCQAVARGMMARRQRPHRHHRLGRRLQGPHQRLDLCGVEGRRDALHALPRRSVARLTTSP